MPSRVYKPEEVDVPGFRPDLPGVRAELATYLNSTRRLDDTFGKVMQALKESGEADNTLVLFITDNGIAVPFAKCNTWFHSSRSPLLVRWPGMIKPGTREFLIPNGGAGLSLQKKDAPPFGDASFRFICLAISRVNARCSDCRAPCSASRSPQPSASPRNRLRRGPS